MSNFDAVEVLASSLSAARTRINTLASNLANAETTRTPEGGPYRRRDVVQMARPMKSDFSSTLDQASLYRPSVQAVVADQNPPKLVYQPGHPDANEEGYVAYPNINIVATMTDLMSAARLYQANLTAVETARRMEQDAAQISIRF